MVAEGDRGSEGEDCQGGDAGEDAVGENRDGSRGESGDRGARKRSIESRRQ